jgi:hypothetical protein
VRLRPDEDGEHVIRPPRGQRIAAVSLRGTPVPLSANADGTVRVAFTARNEYVVSFAGGR